MARRTAGRDHEPAEPFDVAQQRGAALLGDDLPEQPAQQADVPAQRLGYLPTRGLARSWT